MVNRKEVLIVWYQETVFYQICPLGLCGAPEVNDDIQAHRILKSRTLSLIYKN